MANSPKKNNKKLYYALGVIVLLIVLAVVARKSGVIKTEEGVEVTFATAKKADIIERVSASGKIQPEMEIKISPDVPGEIIELAIQEGDSVKQGDFLLKIRPDNYVNVVERARAALNSQRANVSQANARLEQTKAQYLRAKAEFARSEGLFKEKVISEQEFQTAKTNFEVAQADIRAAEESVEAARYTVQSAEATVSEAQTNLSFTSLFAPKSGIVSALLVEKGERVVGTAQMAGTELLRIAEMQNMEVRVKVNENSVVRITSGDTAIIEIDAYPDTKFRGVVTSIGNSAINNSLNAAASVDGVTEFEVRVKVLAESYQHLVTEKNRYPLRPGMSASVEIITERKNNILTVPISAVTARLPKEKEEALQNKKDPAAEKTRTDDLLEVVFVKNEDNTVKMVEVKTGINDFDNIEILSGLEEGQTIIAGPYNTVSKLLKDKDRVREMEKGDNKQKPWEK
ncbi:efflux RND transporter periplasmic adaptor subunit [Hugenholtzia roseola]|uniref:efflux RND transporter periplasmic adaptor subunit n=1 Tax=Hugenholtzia roseola TaxID=1002 RepID=UPI00047EA0E3|nr:efflux RND transporter periplasmic adaptor subunit [Hugenholtzia roseola]